MVKLNLKKTMHSTIPLVFCMTILLCMAGCQPVVRNQGNFVTPSRLAQVTPKTSRKADVEAILGSPTVKGTYADNTWYYIGQTTEQTAFLLQKPTVREIVEVKFNEKNEVISVDKWNLDIGQDIQMTADKTPTGGKSVGALEQIFGNFGGLGSFGNITDN